MITSQCLRPPYTSINTAFFFASVIEIHGGVIVLFGDYYSEGRITRKGPKPNYVSKQ